MTKTRVQQNRYLSPINSDPSRSRLISRNQVAVPYYSSNRDLRRLAAPLRQAVNYLKCFISTHRIAVAAEVMRHAQGKVALVCSKKLRKGRK